MDIPQSVSVDGPHVATIVVLALISRNPTSIRINMPAISIGKPFYRLLELWLAPPFLFRVVRRFQLEISPEGNPNE